VVFSVDAMMKLGYDPECALDETAKEINSRIQDPDQKVEWAEKGISGKWQKWKGQPESTKYIANYDICRKEER